MIIMVPQLLYGNNFSLSIPLCVIIPHDYEGMEYSYIVIGGYVWRANNSGRMSFVDCSQCILISTPYLSFQREKSASHCDDVG